MRQDESCVHDVELLSAGHRIEHVLGQKLHVAGAGCSACRGRARASSRRRRRPPEPWPRAAANSKVTSPPPHPTSRHRASGRRVARAQRASSATSRAASTRNVRGPPGPPESRSGEPPRVPRPSRATSTASTAPMVRGAAFGPADRAGNLAGGAHRHVPAPQLTWGCVASILGIEVGEASRRRRNVAKEPATPIPANQDDNRLALAA